MRRFIQIVLVLLLLTTGGTTWYLYRKGFTKPWREWVFDELRRRGMEITFSKLTVEPFRGLVAKDVKIFDSPERKRVLARVDEMFIEANYAAALKGENFLEALTVVDADADLPLDPRNPAGPAVTVQHLHTRVLFQPGRVFISRFEAEIFGVTVRASGQLANPTLLVAKKPGATTERPGRDILIENLVRELSALRYDGAKPRVDLRFSGDAAVPDSVVVELDVAMQKVRRGDYRLERLAIAGTWQAGTLALPRFELHDRVGRLQLSAYYHAGQRTLEARLRSSLDLPGLARATGLWNLGELEFRSTPQLEMTTRLALPEVGPPRIQCFGQVRLGSFLYGRIPFNGLECDFSWDGKQWALRQTALRHRDGGELRIDAQQAYDARGVGDFRLSFASTLNPEVLLPYFRAQKTPEAREAAARLASMRFIDAPRITLSARGPSPLDAVASGEITLGRTSYRGVEALRARGALRYNGRVLHVDDFLVQRSEGIGGGSLAFDLRDQLVHIKQVRTSLTPMEAALWVDPDLVTDVRPYRFTRKPPQLLLNGVVDQRRGGSRTRLEVKLEAPMMDYFFCGKDLRFTNITARLLFAEERLQLSEVRAELFGGTVKGEADISLRKARPGHNVSLRLGDVDFTSLTRLYFGYDESQGKLNGSYRFTGAGDDGRTMRGTGELSVTDGNVFAIPFLGPFSEVLNRIVPGMGYSRARKATATFTIADGILSSPDLVIEGRGFSMFGDGRIWFLDDRMDFDMRINAQGIPGVLLFPVSKLLEYRTRSSFSKPEWKPKVLTNPRTDTQPIRQPPVAVPIRKP